jgi:hypothetical protein
MVRALPSSRAVRVRAGRHSLGTRCVERHAAPAHALYALYRLPMICAHDAADLGWGIELALALAALGSEVAHEVLIGVAENVIAFSAVLGKVERLAASP